MLGLTSPGYIEWMIFGLLALLIWDRWDLVMRVFARSPWAWLAMGARGVVQAVKALKEFEDSLFR